ncbi:alpha/beta fold hydrolase [uncultured Ilumatobacter sp.]|jgi:pimeloyl-ACP methyl ester carboxylesterase|uniref:alpha/beta fold hydrolase n=1 Tax=uncultured Ilumatobacter sp. TaxID=879968 RepID=UPI00374F2C1B|tara:strand:+ start:698 stop:1471 length:774 start_codon:yes stop_codon:yes gene_type:complete
MQIDIVGSGPSLVLVHSLLTDSRAFESVASTLSTKHRVVRVSLPGFGTTPPMEIDAPTIYDLADTVAAALDQADVEQDAAVLGNGLGAFVCVALAIRHGDRFGPLIVANGGAVFTDERRATFTHMSDLVTAGGMDAVVDVAVRRIFTEQHLATYPEVIEERRAILVETDPGAFAASCRALRDMDLTEGARNITNPAFVIAGGSDQTTPPEMARELAELIPGAEFFELTQCGHCPPLEQPEEFVAAVAGYLRRTRDTQ